jgi:hypothetical protein
MAMLPENAQMVLLIDPNQVVNMIRTSMSVIVPKALTGVIPSMPEGAPVGLTVQMGGGEVRKDLFVPASLIERIVNFVSKEKEGTKAMPPKIPEEVIEQEEK